MNERGIRIDTHGLNQKMNNLHSKIRINVECAIEQLKNFSILRVPLRIPPCKSELLLETHQKNWVIGAVFVNNYI